MRILLVLALTTAACGGSKKAAKSVASPPATEATGSKESRSELRDANKPHDDDDADDERSKSADDPCDGGE